MKKLLILAALLLTAISCGTHSKKSEMKTLVLYYSQNGATRAVAQEIASRLGDGATLAEIVPENPYDGDFHATIERGKKELDEGVLPGIKPLDVDLSAYDVIFLGYPIWFGTYAPPVSTLLASGALNGKKIVPFCTFGSGGLQSSVRNLAKALPDAEILPGYGVRQARLAAMPAEVDRFLKEGGFIAGEVTPLEDFSDSHTVREEETAIFNAAVGDYPMIHAMALYAASRKVPGGVEYCFTAIDMPRDGKPEKLTGISPKQPGPSARKAPGLPDPSEAKPVPGNTKVPGRLNGQMSVYVLVEDGQSPVFTEVVR